MNYLKSAPSGIDLPIQRIQKMLYKQLSGMGELDGYGRVYKKRMGASYSLEAYIGKNEYKSVLGTDTSRFFFSVYNNEDTFDDDPIGTLDIVFMVDLTHFGYGDDERHDEEFKNIVSTVLTDSNFTKEKLYRGDEYLNRLVNGLISGNPLGKKLNFESDDLHPKHIFTFRGTVNYNDKTCI